MRGFDLTGRVFGRLTVRGISPRVKVVGGCRVRLWLCDCACGKTTEQVAYSLTSGRVRSCRCLQSELTVARHTTHGEAGARRQSPEYRTWGDMLKRCRCTDERSSGFRHYSGKGITVCARWLSFERFKEDMGPRPSPDHSIDRIDVNGNYEPGNCRWATMTEQQNNRSNNRLITHDGLTLTVAQWAKRVGITATTLYTRLDRGMEVGLALTTPPRKFNTKGKRS